MDYSIIDVDSHVTEPPDVWTSRVSARHVERVPQVRRVDGIDIWVIDGERVAEVGPTAPAGTSFELPEMPRTYEDLLPAAYDADARLELLDREGIWAQLMYPNVGGFGGQNFLRLGDRDLMYECVRAYNDWQLEWASADSRRLIPVASLPFWDVDDCVTEVERCRAAGFTTILFTGEPHRFDLPFLGESYWDPLWRTVSDAGMPVNLHVGGGKMEWDMRRTAQRGFAETFAIEGLSLFHKNGQQVCDVLLSGILPRYPELKIISVESGIGWLPFALEAIDYQFVEGGGPATRPEFERLPSEYLDGQVFITFWFERHAVRELVGKVIPEECVLFETDFPHPTSLYGNIQDQIAGCFEGVAESVQRKILWENAVTLYGIEEPVPADASVGSGPR